MFFISLYGLLDINNFVSNGFIGYHVCSTPLIFVFNNISSSFATSNNAFNKSSTNLTSGTLEEFFKSLPNHASSNPPPLFVFGFLYSGNGYISDPPCISKFFVKFFNSESLLELLLALIETS